MDRWCLRNHSFIIPSKPMDPRRNKLDIFNFYFNFSIFFPVLMTAFQLLLGLQHSKSCPDDSVLILVLSFITVFFFLRLSAQGFLLSQAVNKTSKLKTINIFVNSFVLFFNITRGNRTLQPQLPFLYKW